MNQKVNIGCIEKITADVSYSQDSARYIGEVLEKEEYKFLLDGIKKKSDLVVVDVGANIGTFSLYVYDIAKEIHSIEAFPELTAILDETIKNNQLHKIRPHSVTIGDFNGEGTMARIEPVAGGGSFLTDEKVNMENRFGFAKCQVLTLDEFCSRERIDHVDLMKIDVEGGETKIINSLDKIKPDVIVGEFHVGRINEHEFFTSLRTKGYDAKQILGSHFIAVKQI